MKKRIMKKIISSILVIALVVSNITINTDVVEAETIFTVDGLNYTVLADKTAVAVSGATSTVITSLEIPDKVKNGNKEYTVTKIAANAFKNYKLLANVKWTENITEIGSSAFYGCVKLKYVDVSTGITELGNQAFGNCTGIETVKISPSLKKAGANSGITSGAFSGCTSWNKLETEGELYKIPDYLFANTSSFTELEIPDTVTEIGRGAFHNAQGITEIEIPKSVIKIGESAFEGANSLKEVVFEEGDEEAVVKTLNNRIFYNCQNLSSVRTNKKEKVEGKAEFPKSIIKIPDWVFVGCVKLKYVDVSTGITELSEYNQINPIITDSMGTYAWDVPEGYWQVKAEKEGYETTYSEWMEVPPIQTDVNLKMSKIDAPKVSSVSIYETYTIVEFDQYVVPETVNNLILKDEKGNLIETTITYDTSQKDWDGNVYAKVFKLEHTATVVSEGTNITLEVSEGIIGSSGKAVEAESIKEVAESHIVVDGGDNLYLVEEDSIDVVFTVSDLFVNNAVVTVEDSSIISVSDVINNEGIYTVTVTGLSKGETTLTITLEELGIQKEVAVTVDSNIALTESVYIHGFQISSTVCGLRTIYSVEEAINGLEVVDRGILYSLADLTPEEELYVGSSHQYVASYSATEAGIISHKFSDSDTATSYAMTMSFGTSTVNLFTAKWRVRAYAQLADGSYVYSEAEEYTVYAVADALYQRRMMSNYPSHNYLYTDILTVVNPDYIKIDYDWNDSVIKF